MNYLAHACLSFHQRGILTGNMISDFVKGKKRFDYPGEIQKGITLHRFIDGFTDSHEATKRAKEVFRPAYRLYAGAFVDVVYDHFLANDTMEYPGNSLFIFSQEVYAELENNLEWLPPVFAMMFPHMKMHNWLFNYQSVDGIGKSFGGLVRRSLYLTESNTASELLDKHYQLFQDCYRQFWADVRPFAFQELEKLNGNK